MKLPRIEVNITLLLSSFFLFMGPTALLVSSCAGVMSLLRNVKSCIILKFGNNAMDCWAFLFRQEYHGTQKLSSPSPSPHSPVQTGPSPNPQIR